MLARVVATARTSAGARLTVRWMSYPAHTKVAMPALSPVSTTTPHTTWTWPG